MIPIGTDYQMRRVPMVNYALVAANVVIFLLEYYLSSEANAEYLEHLEQARLMLDPNAPQLYQFFTSMFLHADVWHLGGNMLFLWVFGNAVNDRFGQIGYAAFYLAGGVLAGIGHILSSSVPVLGASGAIAGVTGAYLVLFPRVRITLLFWFVIITTFQISSLYFLLFCFIKDVLMSLGTPTGVAYTAHISGYIYGIVVAAGLLATGILPRNAFDLLNLIRSAHRRGKYRRMVAQGYDPFSRTVATGEPGTKRWAKAKQDQSRAPDPREARELELRRGIAEAHSRHDIPAAAARYVELAELNDQVVLSQQEQLDVANQLMADHHHADAADAYERFCRHYERHEHIGDIYLMLGLLYGRYLLQHDRAADMLRLAIERLDDPRKTEMARSELDKLSGRSEQG